ncbi:MAG TPA: S8 family serine peptidase [Solirubrobacterales bacterium]|nr:S8 family serine peptidase [Solirubrobacterales bacterium]
MFGRRRSGVAWCVCALVALACAAPGVAVAAEGGSTPLSPELVELAKPAVASRSPEAQAEAIGVPVEGPGGLMREEGGRVVVEAHFEAGALVRVEALREAGAKIELASRRYQTVALSIAPGDLDALAEVPGLSAVEASRKPIVYGLEEGAGTAAGGSGTCEGGSVISQGYQQLNVSGARSAFGAQGAGETIGVLSDSFNKATKSADGKSTIATKAKGDEESDDLPGPNGSCAGQKVAVDVLEDAPTPAAGEEEPADEGRAMLQVIHDLAPEAKLAFATAYSTELQFAENIERLAAPKIAGGAEADVIVDDVGYFAEPFYQEGPVADAIQKVTSEGVTYLTAAGNDNIIESGSGDEFASWERDEFEDTACPSALSGQAPGATSSCLNFSPTGTDATYAITVEKESELLVDLQWEEPWYGVHSDLDTYLLNSSGSQILADERGNNISAEKPYELLAWENKSSAPVTVELVIDRCISTCNSHATSGLRPRLKFILLENGSGVSKTEYPLSDAAAGITVGPTIYGHAGSTAAVTLGAVNYAQSSSAPVEPERYSSRGPVTHYFGPVAGTSPATALAAPEAIRKPNLTATDCAFTTFFATHKADGWHFCGTSEAGPHAAAVAALMQELDGSATPAQIAAAMEESATPYTSVTSPCAVGTGMLNAEAAITDLGTPAGATLPGASACTLKEGEESPAGGGGEGGGGGSAGEEPAPTPVTPTTPGGTETKSQSSTASVGSAAAPQTTIVGPGRIVKTRRATVLIHFTLKADESPVTFICQFDQRPSGSCGHSVAHRFGAGAHTLTVWTEDAAGNVGEAVLHFHVRRIRR